MLINHSKKILQILIFTFPLFMVVGSAIVNLSTIIISIIVLFFYYKEARAELFKNKIIIYLSLFFFYIFLNALINFSNIFTVGKSLGYFRFLLLSLSVFFVLTSMSEKQKSYFIYFNTFLIIFLCLDIIYQYNFNINLLGFKASFCTTDTNICERFAGMFDTELVAGAYLSQIGLLILFIITMTNNNISNLYFSKILIFSFFVFLFITIIITGERNAFLIFLLCIFFMYSLQKKLLKIFTSLLMLVLILFILIKNSNSVNARYYDFNKGWANIENSTIKDKIISSPWIFHYRAAFELFLEKPLLGHGPRSFRNKCLTTEIDKETLKKRIYYKDFRACSSHPHSYAFEFLSEYGLVGFLFYVGLIAIFFINLYKIRNKKKNKEFFLFIATSSLILAIIFPLKPSGSFLSTFNASMLFYVIGFNMYFFKEIK
jgi:O-antigen ligase